MSAHREDNRLINLMDNIDRTMGNTLLMVLLHWNNISQNQNVMLVLDMETNNLCKIIKRKNPEYQDSFVQAHVLTIMLMLMMMISSVFSRSINNNTNIPIYIANTFGTMLGRPEVTQASRPDMDITLQNQTIRENKSDQEYSWKDIGVD